MAEDKDKIEEEQLLGGQEKKELTGIPRRTVLKALAGLPVAGFFGFQVWRKSKFDFQKRNSVINQLGLDSIEFPESDYGTREPTGDIIRVGIIGFGNRGIQLARSLGFMHPDEVIERQQNNSLKSWLEQENLNVSIIGICDVFDHHAQNGLIIAKNNIVTGELNTPKLPVKRYRTYQDMLLDKEIDGVIIATPDHHHARISIDAVKAGKHVYCEKSPSLQEDELNELYSVVKKSDIVYQLGTQYAQNPVFSQAKELIKRNILGKITLIQTNTNRNTANGAFIRHLDTNGNPKHMNENNIDWRQWLGNAPYVPFSVERFYSWLKFFDYNSGLIGGLFVHEFDAVNQLLHIGIPKSVVSSGGNYYWKDNRDMADTLNSVFEYPNHDLTLQYSGSLATSRSRGRVFIGHDASMELGSNVIVTADRNSTRYADGIKSGIIEPGTPIISYNPGAGQVDAVTSASEKYFAARGLTTATINGRQVDITHLHLREWFNCIRNGGVPSANIEMAYQNGITCIMAHKSYVEKRVVKWDDMNRKIV